VGNTLAGSLKTSTPEKILADSAIPGSLSSINSGGK